MGSGLASLSEHLTEEEVKRIARDKFDQAQFDQFKDENGMITKANFMNLLTTAQDNYIHDLFLKFTSGADMMDSRTFAKMMKDSKMVSKTFTNADVDIIFQKNKAKLGPTAKAIPYEMFMDSVVIDIAVKRGIDPSDVMFELTKCEGPSSSGTTADDVRLHNAPARRNSAEGNKISQEIAKVNISKSPSTVNDLQTEALQTLFTAFCPAGEMDSRTFLKILMDCHIVDKAFTNADVDLIFQKVKFAVSQTGAGSYTASSQGKKISFDHFVHIALLSVAEKKKMPVQTLIDAMCLIDGPVLMGTTPDAVRFHDDKSTYPITAQKSSDIGAGIKKIKSTDRSISRQTSKVSSSPSKDDAGAVIQKKASVERASRKNSAVLKSGSLEELALSDVPPGIEHIFSSYCPGGEMDSRTFAKMMKDCNLLDSRYTSGDADLVFQKAKTKEAGGNVAGKKVSYRTFVSVALPGIADKKNISTEALISALLKEGGGGPKLSNVTEADAVRFHDDKSTYTGTHAT